MPAGRPTEYKSEYYDGVINAGAEGKSLTEFAASVDVWRQRLYEWADQFPEFADALKISRAKCRAFWEARGRENMANKEFNSSVWIFSMKSRFGASDQPNEKRLLDKEFDDMYSDEKKESDR